MNTNSGRKPVTRRPRSIRSSLEPYEKALGDTEFVYGLARAVSGQFQELDAILQPMAPEWPLDTIAAIDRNVLRIGLYELRNSAEAVPPKVAINEAVELAKAFGAENSSKFVNGVLGTAYRQIYEPETPDQAPSKEQNEQKKVKNDEQSSDTIDETIVTKGNGETSPENPSGSDASVVAAGAEAGAAEPIN